MYESYLPIPNTELVPISDTTVERNSLGYLILRTGAEDSSNTKIDIPAVVKLYDFLKFKEIIDTEFAEIFPIPGPVIAPPVTASIVEEVAAPVEIPLVEFELWRTRKTFKRIIDGEEFLYPTGFPTITDWDANTWGEYTAAIIKVFTRFTQDESTLVQEFIPAIASLNAQLPEPSEIPVVYSLQTTQGYAIGLANYINSLGIEEFTPYPTIPAIQLITKLLNWDTAGQVTVAEIDQLLTEASIPEHYQINNPQNGNQPFISNLQEFKILCKKIVYWNRYTGFANAPGNPIGAAPWFLTPGILETNLRRLIPEAGQTMAFLIQQQFSAIDQAENAQYVQSLVLAGQGVQDLSAVFNENTYYLNDLTI